VSQLNVWQVRFLDEEGVMVYDALHEDGSTHEDIVRPFLAWYEPIYEAVSTTVRRALLREVDAILSGHSEVILDLPVGTLEVQAVPVIQTGV